MTRIRWTAMAAMALGCLALAARGDDWPQLQHDAARTGHTTDSVAPGYRARWVWCGTVKTLRNHVDNAAWPDDLTSRNGYSFPMPAAVDVTLAEPAQPVIVAGKVFIGSQEGKAFAINADDGTTLWSATLQGAIMNAAAVSAPAAVAVFATMDGYVYGLRTADGAKAWVLDCGFTITGSPCLVGTMVVVGDHGGYVTAINISTGARLWRTRLPKPVQGGMAADGTSLYVGAENMIVYSLGKTDGRIRTQHQVRGQSFSHQWPVVYNGKVWASTNMAPGNGSEYVMESLMDGTADFATEEANIARWLTGDTNGGTWTDASADWKHVFALNIPDLSEPFTILCGPVDGCGSPSAPPVVDSQGRLLMWWKTRFPTLWSPGAFGTKYSLDLAAINQADGHRIRLSLPGGYNAKTGKETDNLYGLSSAGDWVWLNQRFRGMHTMNIVTNGYRFAQVESRRPESTDPGSTPYPADVCYKDTRIDYTTPQRDLDGRCAPAIVGTRIYLTNAYCVTALEHN